MATTAGDYLALTRELLGTPQADQVETAERIADELLATPDPRRTLVLFLRAQHTTDQHILTLIAQTYGVDPTRLLTALTLRQTGPGHLR